MPIELNDVFAIMRGEKKIRDVTNPDVADALTGQDVSGDVLKIGNNLQSVPKETPILGATSSETGGAIFTDQKTLAQSQQEQPALPPPPRIPKPLRSPPATPSTPLSIDPDIIKNTAFRYTAGVTKQTDKQAFYDAHAMLTGSQQFDANKYIQTRLILEKQAAAGNKGASYYLNEFDTYFALKASEFVVSGPLAALDARDTQEAQVNVRKALADVFGGDSQLQEAFLRSGGMESFNNALKQAREYAGDNVSAENLRLERESLRAKTDQSRATAVSKIRGSGSYSPTGSVSFDPTLSGEDRTAMVNSINNIVSGGGDTVAALNDFKVGLSSTAPASREPFVFQDIGTVVDSLQGGRYASVQDVEKAIITAYEKTGNEVTDQNRNALFRAVVGYDDGHAFDAISEEIIAQANGVLRATDNGFIEQWANIENTTGDIQGLSASLGDKPVEKYAEYLDKAIQEEMNASAIEGSSTDDESVKQRARIAATRKVLMDVTGGGGEYMLPATEDQLAGADPRIQEIYAMVGNKLDQVDSSRSAYRTSRINYANSIVAKAQGQDAVKNQNYISIEYGDKDVIVPEGTYETEIEDVIRSNDQEAKSALERSIIQNGIVDVNRYDQLTASWRRIADISIDTGNSNNDEKIRRAYRQTSDISIVKAYSSSDAIITSLAPSKEIRGKIFGSDKEEPSVVSSIAKASRGSGSIQSGGKVNGPNGEVVVYSNPNEVKVERELARLGDGILRAYQDGSRPESDAARAMILSGDERWIRTGIAMLYVFVRRDGQETALRYTRKAYNAVAQAAVQSGVQIPFIEPDKNELRNMSPVDQAKTLKNIEEKNYIALADTLVGVADSERSQSYDTYSIRTSVITMLDNAVKGITREIEAMDSDLKDGGWGGQGVSEIVSMSDELLDGDHAMEIVNDRRKQLDRIIKARDSLVKRARVLSSDVSLNRLGYD